MYLANVAPYITNYSSADGTAFYTIVLLLQFLQLDPDLAAQRVLVLLHIIFAPFVSTRFALHLAMPVLGKCRFYLCGFFVYGFCLVTVFFVT